MQPYMFTKLYWVIVSFVIINYVNQYLLNNVKECYQYCLNSSSDFDKSRYFKDQKIYRVIS